MTDQTQRLEIATVKAEIGSNILHRFSNDALAADAIPTDSGPIQNLKQVMKVIEDKASVSSSIYPTVADGLAATPEGGIFLVASEEDDEIYAVWKKVGGVAVDTGKRTLSSQAVEDATEAAQVSAAESAASALVAQSAAANAAADFQTIFDADQAAREIEFNEFMDALGYESTYLIYGAGIVVERQAQLVQRDGELYRVMNASDIPLTLTGTWATDAPKLEAVGDSALRQAIANAYDPTKGAYMNGFRGRTVGSRLDDYVSVKDDHGAVGGGAKGDGIADDTAAIMAAWTTATISGKALIFPQGKYNHTGLNLAFAYLHIHAIGRVELHNTAPGIALKLDQGLTGNMRGLVFDGDFVITGNALSTDGLFIRSIHDSYIKANVRDVPGTAFVINYGVLTKYDLRCSIEDGAFNIAPSKGVLIDRRAVGQYVADCDFHLVIEGIPGVGVHKVECVGSRFSGTSEYNTKGYQDSALCRDNTFSSFWCEGNTSGFDFEINSERPVFINCKASSIAAPVNGEFASSKGALVIGGYWRRANCQSVSRETTFINVSTSNNASLGIQGTGSHRKINCVRVDGDGVQVDKYTDVLGASGSFSPVFIGTGGTNAHTYSAQAGYYHDIGDRRFYDILLNINTKDSGMTGAVSISGLPGVSRNDANRISVASVGNYTSIATTSARPELSGRILPNTSVIQLFLSGPNIAAIALDSAALVSGSSIILSGSFPRPAIT